MITTVPRPEQTSMRKREFFRIEILVGLAWQLAKSILHAQIFCSSTYALLQMILKRSKCWKCIIMVMRLSFSSKFMPNLCAQWHVPNFRHIEGEIVLFANFFRRPFGESRCWCNAIDTILQWISLICNTLRQVLIICITYLKDLKNEANYDHLCFIYHWPCCCCRSRVSSKGCSHNLQRSVLYRWKILTHLLKCFFSI